MPLVDRLESIVKERGSNFKRVERECGLGNGTMKRWETQSPRLDKLIKVAEYLHVSLDLLVFGRSESETFKANEKAEVSASSRFQISCDGIPLTENEADLVAMYRLLDAPDRKTVFDITKLKYQQKTGEEISIYSTYFDENEMQKSAPDDNDNTASGTA